MSLPHSPIRQLLAAALFAALPVLAQADQNDPRLHELFKQLHEASDAAAAVPVEDAIWQLWLHHDNPAFQQAMDAGIRQMNTGNLTGALATFSDLVKRAPDWAEAWNKRATVNYALENYADSERDIQQTLKLEPFHFGALSGRGLVKAGQKDLLGARAAMEAALEVYPAMPGVRRNLEALEQLLRKRAI